MSLLSDRIQNSLCTLQRKLVPQLSGNLLDLTTNVVKITTFHREKLRLLAQAALTIASLAPAGYVLCDKYIAM